VNNLSFKATVRKNRKTGQKYINVPKAADYIVNEDEEYFFFPRKTPEGDSP